MERILRLNKQPLKAKLKIDSLDLEYWKQLPFDGFIGVDEVGRGCLAGPVVASAVMVSKTEFLSLNDKGWKDSKKLTSTLRRSLSESIMTCYDVALGSSSVFEIDSTNILKASLLAMKRAIEKLVSKNKSEDYLVIVDGNQFIPNLDKLSQVTIVKADSIVPLVSAASIVAKRSRDDLMDRYSKDYQGYGFEDHKGYATDVHRNAISQLGVCPIHRRTFKGVKEFVF